jgi:hypothetical protein
VPEPEGSSPYLQQPATGPYPEQKLFTKSYKIVVLLSSELRRYVTICKTDQAPFPTYQSLFGVWQDQ